MRPVRRPPVPTFGLEIVYTLQKVYGDVIPYAHGETRARMSWEIGRTGTGKIFFILAYIVSIEHGCGCEPAFPTLPIPSLRPCWEAADDGEWSHAVQSDPARMCLEVPGPIQTVTLGGVSPKPDRQHVLPTELSGDLYANMDEAGTLAAFVASVVP
ncbi:hypothetical protein FQN52_000358 [Onygenales sp. PD_12]|nr:hypothetical protein FQN52_000358 [Onygenales sp. PD_12]